MGGICDQLSVVILTSTSVYLTSVFGTPQCCKVYSCCFTVGFIIIIFIFIFIYMFIFIIPVPQFSFTMLMPFCRFSFGENISKEVRCWLPRPSPLIYGWVRFWCYFSCRDFFVKHTYHILILCTASTPRTPPKKTHKHVFLRFPGALRV